MPLEVQTPPPADVRRDFKVHSNAAIKAIKRTIKDAAGNDAEAMYLEGIASSTVRDRHGDTITAQGQAQMLKAAQKLTMWLNHSYEVPEDILGTCEESDLVAGKAADGSDLLDLVIRCKVESTNPRAVKAWQAVENGTQLGFSIGGAITECEVDEDNDDGSSWCPPLIIDGIDLYEISLVGIPANPRSYTRDFVQEMSRGFMRNASRNPEVRKHLRRALPALKEGGEVEIPTFDGTPEIENEPVAEVQNDAPVETVAEAIPGETATAPETEVQKDAADPDDETEPDPIKLAPDVQACIAESIGHLVAGMSHGMCDDAMTSVKKAHKTLSGLLMPSDEPEDEPGTGESGEVENGAEPTITASIDPNVQKQLADIVAELAAKRAELETVSTEATQRAAELETAKAAIAEATAERDTLQKTIDTLKATPTGRQTAQAGGSYVRASGPRTATMHDATKRLGAALTGQAVDDSALRPA